MFESYFPTLECEFLARRRFSSKAESSIAVFSYIEGKYNTGRRHSGLSLLFSIAYERQMQPVAYSRLNPPNELAANSLRFKSSGQMSLHGSAGR